MSPGAQDTVESCGVVWSLRGPGNTNVSFHFFKKTNTLCIVNKQFTQTVFLLYKSTGVVHLEDHNILDFMVQMGL